MCSGYSDHRATNGAEDAINSEEEELQEAIQRSLSPDQATYTPSAPPPSHDDQSDIQMAVERSVADMNNVPDASTNPPPPYNPNYYPQEVGTSERAAQDIQDAETVIVGESEQDDGLELRRRRMRGAGAAASTSPSGNVQQQLLRTRTSIDSVRAARLRRFGGMS